MQLTVNGEMRIARDGETLETLLSGLGLNPLKVAVERNGTIVSRSVYSQTVLQAGDNLEVVEFVGGG
ncbi:MAG: sulfur carrier protein ThiS [Caulobacterales bacterium]|jgi:thiamine biosynthesis protein ThiS